jgi:hypothetical protein
MFVERQLGDADAASRDGSPPGTSGGLVAPTAVYRLVPPGVAWAPGVPPEGAAGGAPVVPPTVPRAGANGPVVVPGTVLGTAPGAAGVGVEPLMMVGLGPVGVADGVGPPMGLPVVVPSGEAAAGLLNGAGETGITTGIKLGTAVVVPPIVGGALGVAGALGVGGAGETVPVVDGVAVGCTPCTSPCCGCGCCCALALGSTVEQPMHRPAPSVSAAARFVHVIKRFMCGFSLP